MLALFAIAGLHLCTIPQELTGPALAPRDVEAARWDEMRERATAPRRAAFRGPDAADSQVGYGPLLLTSQSPLQVLRLSLKPRSPITLAQGRFEIGWHETLVNLFAFKEKNFLFDHGSLMSSLSVAYGVTDSIQVEFGYTDLSKFASILDSLTEFYHDLGGFGSAGRELFPSGQNVVQLFDGSGNIQLLDEESGSWSRDFSFALQHNLTRGSQRMPALSYAVTARANVGGFADLEGSSPFSLGMSAAAAKRFGERFYVYLNAGHVWHGLDEYARVLLEPTQWTGSAALEWRRTQRSAWVVQYLLSEASAVRRGTLDKPSHELGIGWKRELGPGMVLETGLIQNLGEADNSPDIGLHIGLRYRF